MATADRQLRRISITGFRSARDTTFEPGAVCALIGEANAGKSNVLAAIWRLLQPQAPPPGRSDFWRGDEAIRITATLEDGQELSLEVAPPGRVSHRGLGVPVVLLPASLRADTLIAEPSAMSPPAQALERAVAAARARTDGGSSGGALSLVSAVEECCRTGVSGLVVLIEEPELFLRPQAERYLYRLLRELAAENQVIYTTHAPAFLNVARLEELAFVERHGAEGTTIVQPSPLPADDSFRALNEFDAERSELFLSRAALLVEGMTEKVVFPFIFRALGYDPDREAISIVECGGKPNIPLFARVCEAAGVPYLVVHDRDAPPGKRPIHSERVTNAAIAAIAGAKQTVILAPDFEGVAGLHGHTHKPRRASQSFTGIDARAVPEPLAEAARRTVALARG